MSSDSKQPFWLAGEKKNKGGQPRIFKTADELWDAACRYFEWVEANPLMEEKVFHYQGEIVRTEVAKMRAMTLDGLCFFIGISRQTWYDYAKRDGYVDVSRDIDNVIRQQKFSGAAADLLNASIIARDLGLVDSAKVDHTSTDGSMSNKNITVTADTLKAITDKL